MKQLAVTSALILAWSSAFADTTRYGEWLLDRGPDYREAYTGNASGSAVGVWCGEEIQSCFFYIRSNTTCEEGATGITLVNAETGAFSVELLCTKVEMNGKLEYFNLLSNFDGMKKALEENTFIGFSIPMASGEFKVVRFGLRGSSQAIKAAQTLGTQSGFKDSIQ